MTEQLTADDWIKEGLKALAKSGFTALKADPLAKAMGVSRGSFYWHFADLGAFHAALLKRWREIAAERIIADVEAASDEPLKALLRRTFGARLDLERAVRNWAAFDAAAQTAVRAIDRRRLDYIEELLKKRGLETATARARAQILYWTFLGFALSDPQLPAARLQGLLGEILRMVSAKGTAMGGRDFLC
ncbi:TetR/AcrR family transcriptional regulator [Bradyrhizobium sp. 149]|uniref:TetR/AcrR family transcriptional regulator n=1 Tax=Bradyrhizobium sp. 149 TaxID=2782624 RepID=UPI001FFA036B|nr:TetR/AcrR family transcriptional regulator [Bradyrhizobium sp. 149]MCK1650680.1 TetR/AcrR family transcriptional regulator [Bradyrhizobium sp. 149]